MKKHFILVFLVLSGKFFAQVSADTDYVADKIKTSGKTYYYLSALKSVGAMENVNYTQTYTREETPPVYAHYQKGKIKISRKAEGFGLEILQAYPDAVTALWIDWNADGYFYNNFFKNKIDPNDELVDPLFGKPKQDNYGTLEVFVKIPPHAKPGLTRMRLQTTWKTDSKYDLNLYPVGDMGSSSIRDFDLEITD